MAAFGVGDLPGAGVGVIERHVDRLEGQPEQPPRGLEGRLDHLVELEVRLDLGLIEIVFRLAQLLGVIAPVPRRQREVAALFRHQVLQGVAFATGLGAGAAPDFVEQAARRGRGLGHLVVEPVVGEAGEAEQPGALAAQQHHLGDQGAVVGGAAVLAALDPGLEHLLAQIAPGRELQEALARRPRQRDGVLARVAALLGRGARGVAGEIRQAGEVAFVEDQRVGLLVGQHVLPELRCRGSPAVSLMAASRSCAGLSSAPPARTKRVW